MELSHEVSRESRVFLECFIMKVILGKCARIILKYLVQLAGP